jgi:NADPH:quinone reductase-like Zn-dependent oxidoreductase
MRAILIQHRGETGSLQDIPQPQPGLHEILIRVTAAGVNPVDWKRRDAASRLPMILGQDFAGVIVDKGPEVRRFEIGDRVFGIARQHGSYAEFTVVPETDREQPVAKIPDDVGDADAAALPTAGLTALAALERMQVHQGTKLAIVGAVGGVGGFAVQLARERGADIAGTARAENEELATSLGVMHFIAYDRDDVLAKVREIFPNGADALLDTVHDADGLRPLADAVRHNGIVVSIIGGVDERYFADHHIDGVNLVMSETPQSSRDALVELAHAVERGVLTVHIAAEHDLQNAVQALEQSKSGKVDGKLVITVETGRI